MHISMAGSLKACFQEKLGHGSAILSAVLFAASACAWGGDSARLPDDAAAHEEAAGGKPFKLTGGYYHYGSLAGQDINLRYRSGETSFWFGAYRDREFGSQSRAGLESAFQPFSGFGLSLQPSLQLASHGFVGGSLTAELGEPWFVLAGWGRTNLKPYFNLNFDPNDAISLGFGRREESGRTFYVMAVADDRLHTGQKHIHFVSRLPMGNGERLTVDVLHKVGEGDEGPVNVWGASVTYDWKDWFVRLANDPKQNFSASNAVRMSVGARF